MPFNVNIKKSLEYFTSIARHHGEDVSAESLIHHNAVEVETGPITLIGSILRHARYRVKEIESSWKNLHKLTRSMPLLSWDNDGKPMIIVGFNQIPVKSPEAPAGDEGGSKEGNGEKAGSPEQPPAAAAGGCGTQPTEERIVLFYGDRMGLMSEEEFLAVWSRRCLLTKKIYSLTDEKQPFGLRWFLPQILKEKRVFRDVAIITIVLNVTALAAPLYFQLLIDKVLTHHSFSTLQALSFGLLIVILFEVFYNFLKRYLLIYATRKIDFRLAKKTFEHLAALPINFFDTNPSGVLLKHMQQTNKIRGFLTGRIFMTFIDATSLFVVVPFLWLYSSGLSIVVISFSVIIGILLAIAAPYFKKKLTTLYIAEGERQANLVEMITGMRTVKSLAIEPVQVKKWDRLTSETTRLGYEVGTFANDIQTFTLFMQKLLTLLIPWMGAGLVINGTMSVGALVAFNMLAGRVSGPLVKMVTLISDAQDIRLSIEMLGNIMNARPERQASQRGLMPQIKGNITLQGVSFRYPGANTDALDKCNLRIPAGVTLGIVGKSGSGKSTLARLIQGLYIAQAGLVQIDGLDIREIDLPHLRKNIGIVLQENYYFRGTVRENIALTKPNATFEEIVNASILAGADEFVKKLPQGYDTLLQENASNLSGGQKQRLAIARALLSNPSIMILDEATSALDAESEAIVQENLGKIARNRTMIIISHRLSILSTCDKILVMDNGRFVDVGNHEELMGRCPLYRDLWMRQNRHLLKRAPDGSYQVVVPPQILPVGPGSGGGRSGR